MGMWRTAAVSCLAALVASGGTAPGAVAEIADGIGSAALPRAEVAQRSAIEAAGAVGIQAVEDCLQARTDGTLNTLRYAGMNRYETSACVSREAWADHDDGAATEDEKADAVVLARGDLFPDALAGGPLAAYKEAPLLLTTPASLPAVTLSEIQRVLAPGGDVYLLGGEISISSSVENDLVAEGFNTIRLAGSNRYQTAIEIAEELPDTSNFFFVTGRNFPDALAAGTAASAMTLAAVLDSDPGTRPVVLMPTNDDVVPLAVENFVINRGTQFGEWALLTAGGQADAAAADAFLPENLVLRFVGANRYETATMVAEGIFTDLGGQLVGTGAGLATGLNFPDALSASPYLALFAEPLLLTQATSLSSAPQAFLETHAGEGQFLDIFGGDVAISDTVENAAIVAFQ